MRTSEQINDLATALAAAQGAFTNPAKDREVKVRGQTKAGKDFDYTFKYATFTAVVDAVRKPLADNGLSFLQTTAVDEHGHIITTRLLHASGQYMEFDTPVFVASEGAQAFGSGVTYAKRYALSTMLGITADEDDDGHRAEGNDVDMRTRTPGAPKPPPRPPQSDTARTATISRDTRQQAAEAYVAQSIEAFGKMATQTLMTAWWTKNTAYTDKLEANFPELYERLVAAFDERRDSFRDVTEAA